MMKTLKNNLSLLLYWVVAFAIAFLIVYFNCPGYKNYIGTPFQFTFIGVLLGFSLTLFNHIVNQIEKKQIQLQSAQGEDSDNYKNKINQIKILSEEVKDDVRFLFYSLIIIVIISIISDPLKKIIHSNVDAHIYELSPKIKEAFLLSIFFLCLLAVWDLVNVSLRLSGEVILGKNKESEKSQQSK